jgi:RraA family protein
MPQRPESADLHPGPGFQVRLDCPRLDRSLMDRFLAYDTPTISDLLNRLYALDPAIRCLTGETAVMCGPVCTVKVFPGDNLMVHKSLDVAKPGDIVVIDANGSQCISPNAVLGDTICTKARHRKIAGFIVDGFVRDLPGMIEVGLPVYARGTTPVGPLHRGPGEVNFPIACGGTVINPGDVIVADSAGIVNVPREVAEALLASLDARKDKAAAYMANVQRGEFSNDWVDEILTQNKCPIDNK